ncbi:hypothetical protein LPJ53_001298 [Coemansia erecta]|uniref:L domain-like protein n=1 Tax=Coemansia erecta TaxID=147472 RepID=A0A9W7Y609_9FUNG|nr:hypothetical protein LPJ53_001298 [Coemansia erecta]
MPSFGGQTYSVTNTPSQRQTAFQGVIVGITASGKSTGASGASRGICAATTPATSVAQTMASSSTPWTDAPDSSHGTDVLEVLASDTQTPSTAAATIHPVAVDRNPPAAYEGASLSLDDLSYGTVNLSFRFLVQVQILPGIAKYVANITSLIVSNNSLIELPDEIGHLRQLQIIDVSNNELETLPATIAYCRNLRVVYARSNKLSTLPSSIRHLHGLTKVDLYNNRIDSVPPCLWRLPILESLDLSHNPIQCLPSRMFVQGGVAAINRAKPFKLMLDGCPLDASLAFRAVASDSRQSASFPSLVETIVSAMANQNAAYPADLPDHLLAYFENLTACDYCYRLYPAAGGVKRWRLLCRNGVNIPIEFRLCRPHWNTENQRIALLFAPRKPEHTQPYYKLMHAATDAAVKKLSQGTRASTRAYADQNKEHIKAGSLRRGIRRLLSFAKGRDRGVQPGQGARLHRQQLGPDAKPSADVQSSPSITRKQNNSAYSRSSQPNARSGIPMWQYYEDDIPDLPKLCA